MKKYKSFIFEFQKSQKRHKTLPKQPSFCSKSAKLTNGSIIKMKIYGVTFMILRGNCKRMSEMRK